MCGIFGFNFKQGTISTSRAAILSTNLARLNDNRGGHSWGFCATDNNELVVKRGLGDMAMAAHQMIDHTTLFGHTRYGTTGANTVENAHPFEIGNIIGAHNGIVYNHTNLQRKYDRNHEVDSQHFFSHLNENKDFSDIEGYGSIEWIQKDDPSHIYLCKMRNGELSIFGIGDRSAGFTNGVVWSSNDKHLMEALFCAGIKDFFPYTVEEGQIYYAEAGEIYVSTRPKLILGSMSGNYTQKWDDDYHGYQSFPQRPHTPYQHQLGSGSSSSSNSKNEPGKLTTWESWSAYCRGVDGVNDDTKSDNSNIINT